LQHIYLSRNHILAQDYQSKRYNISKAADIVNYLRTCLNFEDKQAADLVTLLDSLYVFLEKSLLQATLKNETQYLDQAEKVLSIVKSGWDGIASK
jgi:flagellar protein FliS